MSSRVLVVGALVAIAAGIAWFALRDRGAAPAQRTEVLTTGSAAGSSGKAAISAPEGPRLGSGVNAFETVGPVPALPDAQRIDAPSHRDVYTAQPVDSSWATRTQDELKHRVRTLALTAVQGVECRTDQCELTITGSAGDVEETISTLEGPKGLTGFAKSILLGGPEQRDGRMTIRVYALFER